MQRQKNTQPANEGAAPGTTSKHALRVLRRWGRTDLKPVTDDASSTYSERGSIFTLGGAENDLQPFAMAEEGGTTSDTPLALGESSQRRPQDLDVRDPCRPLRLAGHGAPRSPKLQGHHGRGPPALGGSDARPSQRLGGSGTPRSPGLGGSGTRRRLPKLGHVSGPTEIRYWKPTVQRRLVIIPPKKAGDQVAPTARHHQAELLPPEQAGPSTFDGSEASRQ